MALAVGARESFGPWACDQLTPRKTGAVPDSSPFARIGTGELPTEEEISLLWGNLRFDRMRALAALGVAEWDPRIGLRTTKGIIDIMPTRGMPIVVYDRSLVGGLNYDQLRERETEGSLDKLYADAAGLFIHASLAMAPLRTLLCDFPKWMLAKSSSDPRVRNLSFEEAAERTLADVSPKADVLLRSVAAAGIIANSAGGANTVKRIIESNPGDNAGDGPDGHNGKTWIALTTASILAGVTAACDKIKSSLFPGTAVPNPEATPLPTNVNPPTSELTAAPTVPPTPEVFPGTSQISSILAVPGVPAGFGGEGGATWGWFNSALIQDNLNKQGYAPVVDSQGRLNQQMISADGRIRICIPNNPDQLYNPRISSGRDAGLGYSDGLLLYGDSGADPNSLADDQPRTKVLTSIALTEYPDHQACVQAVVIDNKNPAGLGALRTLLVDQRTGKILDEMAAAYPADSDLRVVWTDQGPVVMSNGAELRFAPPPAPTEIAPTAEATAIPTAFDVNKLQFSENLPSLTQKQMRNIVEKSLRIRSGNGFTLHLGADAEGWSLFRGFYSMSFIGVVVDIQKAQDLDIEAGREWWRLAFIVPVQRQKKSLLSPQQDKEYVLVPVYLSGYPSEKKFGFSTFPKGAMSYYEWLAPLEQITETVLGVLQKNVFPTAEITVDFKYTQEGIDLLQKNDPEFWKSTEHEILITRGEEDCLQEVIMAFENNDLQTVTKNLTGPLPKCHFIATNIDIATP